VKPSPRLLLTVALGLAAMPMVTAAAGEPACDDPVAHTIHDVEEATHLHALHVVEDAYCGIR
jgi:hypothetical protein